MTASSRPPGTWSSDEALAVAAVRAALAVAVAAPTRAVVATKAGPNDLLTATDLAAEQVVRATLAVSALPVQGEEGSPDVADDDRWVVDPVDGTANFVAGLPLVATTVARVAGGEPVVGATGDLTIGEVVHGSLGGGAWLEAAAGAGRRRLRVLTDPVGAATVTIGDLPRHAGPAWPVDVRARAIAQVGEVAGRLRVVGTSATELAWVATGRTAGAVLFGNHPWDVAAGVVLVREAGGVVLDAHGAPWSFGSDSLLAASSPATAQALVAAVGRAWG